MALFVFFATFIYTFSAHLHTALPETSAHFANIGLRIGFILLGPSIHHFLFYIIQPQTNLEYILIDLRSLIEAVRSTVTMLPVPPTPTTPISPDPSFVSCTSRDSEAQSPPSVNFSNWLKFQSTDSVKKAARLSGGYTRNDILDPELLQRRSHHERAFEAESKEVDDRDAFDPFVISQFDQVMNGLRLIERTKADQKIAASIRYVQHIPCLSLYSVESTALS